jgi:hypothetical protein
MSEFTGRRSGPRANPFAEAMRIYGRLGSRLFDAYYDAAKGWWDLSISPRTPLMRMASAVNGMTAGLLSGVTGAARRAHEDTQELIIDLDAPANGESRRPRRERSRGSRPKGAARSSSRAT